MYVIRRDGTRQELDRNKIRNAIIRAFKGCNQYTEDTPTIAEVISNEISYWEDISIDDIQEQVIEVLRSYEYDTIADAYLMYKAQKDEARKYIQENIEYMMHYLNTTENAASASATDSNANVTLKNVSNMESEVPKVRNRLIQRAWMKRALNELYPELTKQYEADLNHHIIYAHDEASTPTIKNYCEAVSLYPLLIDGTSTMDGTGTKAPKHLVSFAGQLCNLLFLLSSQCKGACLYKDQKLLINGKETKIKDFVSSLLRSPKSFIDDQDNYWEYSTVEGNYSIEEDGKLAQITKVFRRPYSDKIYKISSNKGFTVTVSKNHKFKVLRQGQITEVEAKDLQLFDTVFVNNEYNQFVDFNSLDFKRGFIHGMLLGDGNLTQFPTVGLSVNYNQEYYVDIFNSYSEELYGSALNKCSGHNCWNYQKKMPEYYQEITKGLVGNNTFDKHVDQIEDKNVDYIVGLLDGLLRADGGKNHSIILSLVNKTLILQIEKILKLLRINYSYTEIPEHDNKSRMYQLCISSTITRYTPHFISKFTKSNKNKEVYYFSGNSRKNGRRNPNYILSTTKDHFIYKDYKLDVITSIETFDNDDDFVYEIETSTHWYNCGGFITHNCAFGEFFNYFDYFAAKDYGENYHERADVYADSEFVINRQTIGQKIDQTFQQIVFYWNQPAGNRGSQSPFSNISYYDKNYWKALFEDFYFPDGTQPKWERVDWLQKRFMRWFNKERTKTLLTFPVNEICGIIW